jgi:hypothetical protein
VGLTLIAATQSRHYLILRRSEVKLQVTLVEVVGCGAFSGISVKRNIL